MTRALLQQALDVLSDERYVVRYSQIEETIAALHAAIERRVRGEK